MEVQNDLIYYDRKMYWVRHLFCKWKSEYSLIFLLIGVMFVLHMQREWRTQYVRKQSLLDIIPIPVVEIKKPKAHEY